MIQTRPGPPSAAPTDAPDDTMRVWPLVLFMAATSLGYFVVQLDVSIVNLSLPALQRTYGIDVAMLQWIVNAYTLSFSVALLSAGVLGDRYGNKTFLMVGYAIFAIGSLACAVAPTISLMLAARFLQGIGAAIIVPNSLAAINGTFSKNEPMRLALVSTWVAFGGAGLTCGPILGGLITSIANWRYIFLINLPVCALGILLTTRHVAAAPRRAGRKQDWIGQGLVLTFATALLILIIDYAALPHDTRLALGAVAALGFGAFIAIESRLADPAVPLRMFRDTGLRKALIFGGLINFVYFGVVFFASLYFRRNLHMSPLRAGLSFIPITLPLVIANLLGSRISRRHGPDRVIALGFALMIPGLLYLALPSVQGSYALMLPAFVLTTFGIGFIPPMTTAIAMRSLGPERGGMVSAIVNFCRQISGAFGVAVFGIFIASGDDAASYRHFGIALVAVALVLLAAIGYFAIPARGALRTD
ncbi:MFS transporter [Burkholderia alba]|uniref:MFS transporter n=1 Tax=Burkholderia alba TaxID=2683677 RepID=UPI002B05D022|nr:MFS transporter [Burkholderia alba]